MAQPPVPRRVRRTRSEEFAHSLRNVAAVMEGSLRVLAEAERDDGLAKAAYAALGRQVEHLKDLAEHTPRLRPSAPPGGGAGAGAGRGAAGAAGETAAEQGKDA
jgi:hypothetical protein